MSINKIIVSGHLTRDSELRRTRNDKAVLNFCVAMNGGYKSSVSGEWVDKVCFIECTIFGKRAESLHEYLKRGIKVCVLGKIDEQTWEDKKTGQIKRKHVIMVDDVELFMQKKEGYGYGVEGGNTGWVSEESSSSFIGKCQVDDSLYDEDVPF